MPDLSTLSTDDLIAMHQKAMATEAPAGDADLSKMSTEQLIKMHKSLSTPVPAKPEGVGGIADAGLRGAAQGASLGFADEAAAGVGGLKDYVSGKLGLRGDISLPDAYHTWRDVIRRADAQAAEEHPYAYNTGQVAGALATSAAPGLNLLNVGKGAGLVEAGLKGASIGALAGTGNAQNITDVPSEALHGAAVGGLVGGGLNVAGRVGSAVLDKLKPASIGSVILNAPESALQRYIENPEAVNAARPRSEIVQDAFLPRIEALKNEVTGGSAASRAILDQEGKTVAGSTIANLLDTKKAQILARSEGVMDDPAQMAAVKWLDDLAAKYRPQAERFGSGVVPTSGEYAPAMHFASGSPESLMSEAALNGVEGGINTASNYSPMAGDGYIAKPTEKVLTTNRIKDLVQNLDNQTEYEVAPGKFAKVSDAVRKDVRSQIDGLLKGKSEAYTEQMKKVATDTSLLNEVSDLARSPQGFDNLLKRTQRGTTPQLMDALQRFDERTGGGLLQELQDSAVKDALAKGTANGSRNVNMQGVLGDTVGAAIGGLPGRFVGRAIGVLGGATTDKYGGPMARALLDRAAQANAFLDNSPAAQALGSYVQPLLPLAAEGNRAPLIETLEAPSVTSPLVAKDQKKDAIRRRLGE